MFLTFLRHQRLSILRSKRLNREKILNILLAIVVAYFALNLVAVGFLLDNMLEHYFPDEDVFQKLNGFLLGYFCLDLAIRLMFQNPPNLSIQPYLHLPIKKNKLVQYILIRSTLSLFNYLPLLVLIPFAIKVVFPSSFSTGITWLLTILLLIFINNFLGLYLKQKLADKSSFAIVICILYITIYGLDYFSIIDLTLISDIFFKTLLDLPYLLSIVFLVLGGLILINYKHLKSNLYPSESTSIASKRYAIPIDLLANKGEIWQMVLIELKLILRNKRTKSLLLMILFFSLYGLIFYPSANKKSLAELILPGMMVTSMSVMSYGQFMFGWEGGYFDFILSQKINLGKYLLAKVLLLSGLSVINFLIALPYIFFSINILYINTALLFYNLGVVSFIILSFATFNYKKIDLGRSTMGNYQGISAIQYVMTIPLLALPYIIYFPLGIALSPTAGIAALGAVGLIGLLLYKVWLNLLVKQLVKQKYKISEGFRESE